MTKAQLTVSGAAQSGSTEPLEEVTLTVEGVSFTESVVVVTLADHQLLTGTQIEFHAFCAHALGTGSREWPRLADGDGLQWFEPGPSSGFTQNLMKALMLVSLWIEPRLVSGATSGLDQELDDEIIVDYTGRLGAQRYIYFPPGQVVNSSQDAIETLFAFRLLCRLSITIGETRLERFFVPLAPPGVLLERLAGASKTWGFIRDAMARRIRALGA